MFKSNVNGLISYMLVKSKSRNLFWIRVKNKATSRYTDVSKKILLCGQ